MNDIAAEERGFVYAIARRIVRAPHDADDVTQEALLLAHRHRDSFRGESRYRTWLYRIATTTALGFLRRQRRDRHDPIGDPDQYTDPTRPADLTVALAEECTLLARAFAELKPPYRDVLLARVDATEPEVAERLRISVGNVKIRTHRARKQLRRALDAA